MMAATPSPGQRAFLSLAGLATLAERCNTDRRFGEWGRGFSGVIAFGAGAEEGWMRVAAGRVIAVGAVPVEATLRISGSLDDWQPILDGQQGGLHRAWRHQRLAFQGDRVALMRSYKMVWRLGDLLAGEGPDDAISG